MADPVVHITNGVPDSGTGTITTLGAVVAALPAALGAGGGLKVDGSGTALPISGTVAISGTVPVSIATAPVLVAGTAIVGKFGIDQTTDGLTNKVSANVKFGGTAADIGAGTGGTATQRVIVDSSQLGALQTTAQAMSGGFTPVALPTDQRWATGMSPRAFAATFSTLTRPANATAYSAGDSISDNATAGSVTALTATVSDTNDDPITITDIIINSTDTGLAGKKIRAYLFNSDPTASTGVGGGDNAAYSQKKAGYLGSFMGWMETGFSDGTVGRLVPTFNETNNTQAGGFIVMKPTSGAKTLFIQYQAVEPFTPSGSSTTIIGSARGYQGRAS